MEIQYSIIDIPRMFNRYMESGIVLEGWKAACNIPIYKGKGDRSECGNY